MYGPRWVEVAAMRPHHCCVFPQLGASHVKGYVDTGIDLNGPGGDRAYVSVEAVEQLSRLIGWQPPGDASNAQARVEELEREVKRLEDENADLNRDFEAIDMLASRGFTARKKPGRPRKEAVHGDS